MGLLRLMEMIFFLYFLISVPIAILFDSQAIAEDLNISKSLYPEPVVELGKQYVAQFKDPYFLNPPSWYKALVFSEILVQMPFCVVASIAMLLGSRKWMRTPLIIYSSHIATTLLPILYSFAVDDFAKMKRVGPETEEERLKLIAVYAPFLVMPLLILLTVACSGSYSQTTQPAPAKSAAPKKKHLKSH